MFIRQKRERERVIKQLKAMPPSTLNYGDEYHENFFFAFLLQYKENFQKPNLIIEANEDNHTKMLFLLCFFFWFSKAQER